MGRIKKEMKRINAKRRKQAKKKVKSHLQGEIKYANLNSLAKKRLKRIKTTQK